MSVTDNRQSAYVFLLCKIGSLLEEPLLEYLSCYPQVATVGGWLWCLLQPFCWSLFFIFVLYYLCASKMPWLSPNTMLVERLVVISIILIVICSIYWEKKYLARSSWEGGELVSFHCLSADRSPCSSHYIWGWRLRLAFILLTTKKYTRFVFL
jgi:hypothetical protein